MAAHFIGLRGDSFEENLARVGLILGIGSLVKKVNKHYSLRSEIYNKIIDKTNDMLVEIKNGEFKGQDLPEFKELYDEIKNEVSGSPKKKKALNKKFNNNTANITVNLVLGMALSIYAYKGIEYSYRESDAIKEIVKRLQPERPIEVPDSPQLKPPAQHPN